MAFLRMNVLPDQIVEALHDITIRLQRIAEALDRLAPAPPPFTNGPRIAGLQDLRRTDPSTVQTIQSGLEQFAQEQGVMLNSEAFIRAIQEFERQVIESYGKEALLDLPWNKAAGGAIFQGDDHHEGGKKPAKKGTGEQIGDHLQSQAGPAPQAKPEQANDAVSTQGSIDPDGYRFSPD